MYSRRNRSLVREASSGSEEELAREEEEREGVWLSAGNRGHVKPESDEPVEIW